MNPLFLALVVIASISPLLTFATLWQVKEWRIDRLKEHFRNEGAFRQHFGIVRPIVVVATLILLFLKIADQTVIITGGLSVLAALSIIQIALRKQRIPVWTQKAIVLVGSSLIITTLLTQLLIVNYQLFILFVPIIQPDVLALSWILLWPVDRFLKNRIMKRAMAIRAKHEDLVVVGITGSVGKTTTKELLAHILRNHNALVTPAYVNSEMGVAQWIEKKLSTAKSPPSILVVEMGAYRKGEIALLCKIAQPTVGIVTFVGKQHVALFGSQEALCEAKAELLDALPEDGHAFLNGDSSLCEQLKNHCRCTLTTVGTGGHADKEAFDIEETPGGIQFRLGDTMVTVPLHGTHNVTNIMLAITCAEHIGIPRQEVLGSLRSFSPPEHTFSVSEQGGVTILNDTHNASPESFKAAITWARSQPAEHKVLLTSGLIEVGQGQDRVHEELGGLSSNVFQDVIFLSKRSANSFAKGYEKDVKMFSKDLPKIPPGTLLVCVGRMSQETINHLL